MPMTVQAPTQDLVFQHKSSETITRIDTGSFSDTHDRFIPSQNTPGVNQAEPATNTMTRAADTRTREEKEEVLVHV